LTGGDNPLAFLANNPMFAQLRAAIQQNPQMLQALLAQIAQSNPQLFQVYKSHYFSYNLAHYSKSRSFPEIIDGRR